MDTRFGVFRFLAHGLEILQVFYVLHLEGQEECELVLTGDPDERTPFHEEIRANWDQFVSRVGENDQLENFEISNIGLPPAPLFADKMAPSLQKSSLMRLLI